MNIALKSVAGWSHEMPIGPPPVSATRRNSRMGGLLFVAFALVWGGFPTWGMLQHGTLDPAEPIFWIAPLFGVIGVALVAYGLHLMVWQKTVTFDGLFVRLEQKGLFGTKTWQESIGGYRGVLARTRTVHSKNHRYTLYLVDLVHGDEERTVNLYTGRTDRDWRAKQEAYARWLKLPALDEDADGFAARDAADLDKPVGELIGEGKVAVDYDILETKAEGLSVEVEGDTVVATCTSPQTTWWGALVMVLFPLVFVYFGFFHEGVDLRGGWLMGGFGLFFEALLLAGVIWDWTTRRRLRVGPDRVTVNTVGPRGETRGRSLAAGEIEVVKLGHKKESRGAQALVIVSDRGTLQFGQRLPEASLEFLRHLVLAKIAKHHGAGR